MEAVGVSYFDGFVGSLAAHFREDLVERDRQAESDRLPASFLRLWKLHGSLNWEYQGDGRVVRRGSPVDHDALAAIYPSDEKYDQSRRVPFVVLHDRFRRALAEPETLTLIVGYSFGDDHLNEVIIDAARRYPRSEIVALFRTTIPSIFDDTVLPNLTVMGPRCAVIGGDRRDWAAPDTMVPGVWNDDGFRLGDFDFFSRFMARTSRNTDDFIQPLGRGSDGI